MNHVIIKCMVSICNCYVSNISRSKLLFKLVYDHVYYVNSIILSYVTFCETLNGYSSKMP